MIFGNQSKLTKSEAVLLGTWGTRFVVHCPMGAVDEGSRVQQ